MNLIIKKYPDIIDSKDFYSFIKEILVPEIQYYIITNINSYYINMWDEYLRDEYSWNIGEYPPKAYDIILQGTSEIQCKEHKNEFIIQITPNKIIPGTTAKLDDICNEINYGNFKIPPYPIFSNAFKWANDNIFNLIKEYFGEYE